MPVVIPAPVALRSRLRDVCGEALVLLARLEGTVAVKSSLPGGHPGKGGGSRPPWNSAVALAALDLHAWARDSEALARARLSLPFRFRGGSARNTARCLDALSSLAQALDDADVAARARWLESWGRRAREILGEAEAARRLPRNPGAPEPLCPFCRRDTLRQLAAAGVIRCVDPSCRDEEGRRPAARLELFDGEWVIRWQDGVIGAP